MSYRKIIREENASYNCHTITDLIDSFKISVFDDYFKNVFRKFPADDKYDVIYDKFMIVSFNDDYCVHVFHGTSINPVDSPEYTIVLDLRHGRIYYIAHSGSGNFVSSYGMDGNLLSQDDYGLKSVDLDNFIDDYLMEHACNTIRDLLVNFNVNIELSDKLLDHEIESGFGTVFCGYYIQEGKEGKYYVFTGYFTEDVCDVHPPTIYIDSERDVVYFRYDTGWGVNLYRYDSLDNESEVGMFNFDWYGEYDLEKLLLS